MAWCQRFDGQNKIIFFFLSVIVETFINNKSLEFIELKKMNNINPTIDQIQSLYKYANRNNDRVKAAVIRFLMNYIEIDEIMKSIGSPYKELMNLHRNHIIISIDRSSGDIEAFDSITGELDAIFFKQQII